MSVRRFTGANSRDVMRQVRETLGDDALILANRRTDDGVEIMAMADEAVEPVDAALEVTASTVEPATATDPLQAMSERLLREMQDMRALLTNQQVTSQQVPRPTGTVQQAADTHARLSQLLTRVGFSAELGDEVLAGLPASLKALGPESEQPLDWLRQQLTSRLHVLNDEASFFDQTGIVALVGPTGIGKTTTTAKLAARFVMRHGTRPVALVTTDSFRIGAHEQLRIYARLLDTPMYALDAEQPVDDLLGRLHGKQWVMIDTVGMSQRDQRVIDQIAHLQDGSSTVRLVLLLNAASQPETLEEVVLRYRQAARAAGAELDDCIITKQDEAGRLAPVLDIVIRHGMRVLFSSHGQQVPEDMSVALPDALINQALESQAKAAPQPGFTAPASMPRWSRDVLGQGRRLSLLLTRLRQRLAGFATLEAMWDVSALPSELQSAQLTRLLPHALPTPGVVWAARRNERGCDWSMPDISMDERGAWHAVPMLQHRQPAGWQARLETRMEAGATVHLLPVLPPAETVQWLNEQQLTWVSLVTSAQRVYFHGERSALRGLFEQSTLSHHVSVRFRGQSMQLWTAYAEVQNEAGSVLLAWYGEVRDPESAKVVARRYWLTPARLGADVLFQLVIQLQSEGLAALTKRVLQQFKEADSGDVDPEVRLLLASGVASVVGHLDNADDDEASSLRSDLLSLLGTRRKRRDTAMLDALMYAFMARDAIRQLGSVSREVNV
ncbi:Flagellar biosynthesis protein FlhF [Halomonas citrativorans]|uniref:Flagellar biosynthesis protein FlhF n=1 Tax=Halomonas citrativorans TaxID=2742612 RepID=A0A1R4I1N3_9GAMM|nr:flagellar biosynthesis protein FlhF [Halomonas citrativorans]SJN13656.1 Flagellar biosynthesis protein FlhF [Halomonas citrativorans]